MTYLYYTIGVSFNFLIQEDVKHENLKTGFQSKKKVFLLL